MKQIAACLCLFHCMALVSIAQRVQLPIKDAYLGEAKPGTNPVLFAPGRVSDGMSNRDMAISPRGDDLFYTIQSAGGQVSVVVEMTYRDGQWTGPVMAPFSGIYEDLEPAFSGNDTLFFVSDRPSAGMKIKNYDIWRVVKSGGTWGDPVRLDTTINSEKDEFYPSVARSGNLYFTREVGGSVNDVIMVSEWGAGRYQPPHSLPEAINSGKNQFNAFVDPEEQYLFFSSIARSGEWGGGDLYVSVKNRQGEWTPAVLLDSTINSKGLDFCPYVTPDKQYFFFTSDRMRAQAPFDKKLSYAALKGLLQHQGNGLNDIYWMEWPSLLKAIMKNNP